MKTKRQRKIIELISEFNIETQEELAALLEKEGFNVTQATISRDIRELNLTKTSSLKGGQKYVVPVNTTIDVNNRYLRVVNEGIIKMDIAENILVIKTVSGMAMAVGAVIDAMDIKDIVGCIAGDDTVMCVVRTKEEAPGVKKYLEDIM